MNRREFVARLKDTALGAALLPLLGKEKGWGFQAKLLEPSEEEVQIDRIFPDYLVCHLTGNGSRILVRKNVIHQVSPWDGRTVEFKNNVKISYKYRPGNCNVRTVTDGTVIEDQVLDPPFRVGQRIVASRTWRVRPQKTTPSGEEITWVEAWPVPSGDRLQFRAWRV